MRIGSIVSLNRVPKKRTSRSRLHLDLYTNDRETEGERLVKIGPLVIPGGIGTAPTSWCWKIPMATCFAWCRSRTRLDETPRQRARLPSEWTLPAHPRAGRPKLLLPKKG